MNDPENHLAEFTDHLLARPPMKPSAALSPEEQTILRLQRLLVPSDDEVPAAFRQQLTQRLNQEWSLAQRNRRRRESLLRLRWSAVAAATLVVVVGVALLWGGSAAENTTGTAAGEPLSLETMLIIGSLLLAGLGVAGWWLRRR